MDGSKMKRMFTINYTYITIRLYLMSWSSSKLKPVTELTNFTILLSINFVNFNVSNFHHKLINRPWTSRTNSRTTRHATRDTRDRDATQGRFEQPRRSVARVELVWKGRHRRARTGAVSIMRLPSLDHRLR